MGQIYIYNTLSGKKEALSPQKKGEVGIYVCGPTVYDMSHIGHARVYVAFDTVVRHLRRNYRVTHVRNYTDVDDKIIKKANEGAENPSVVSERYIKEFNADMRTIGVAPADIEPKVTTHIDEIISMVESLVTRGHAYDVGGDVYFSVKSYSEYGHLARRNLEDMEAGARVDVDPQKKNPMDFALWKSAKPGEPKWASPWGEGRPGWHIECSAMALKHLGVSFDIHAGGKDLIFPHHENEIAQSQCANGAKYVHTWMHNGFVTIDDEKMSKSLGNFFTIREVLKSFHPQTLRYYLLQTHYRSPINFSDAALKETQGRIKYIYETLARLEAALGPLSELDGAEVEGSVRDSNVLQVGARFDAAMDDDFNTAKAISELSDVFKLVNECLDKPGDSDVDERTLRVSAQVLLEAGSVLGLFLHPPKSVLKSMQETATAGLDVAKIDGLVVARDQARKERDFARADAIRAELLEMGVVLKDVGGESRWEIAS